MQKENNEKTPYRARQIDIEINIDIDRKIDREWPEQALKVKECFPIQV